MKGIKAYQKVQVMTADGVHLVVMLYEGVVKFNRMAIMAIEDNDIEKRTLYINKSAAIISELCNALDMKRGAEVAVNLRDLYIYSLSRLSEANNNNSAKLIDEVTAIILEVKEGWDAIALAGTRDVKPGLEVGA